MKSVAAENLSQSQDTIPLNSKNEIRNGWYNALVTCTGSAANSTPQTFKLLVNILNSEVISVGIGYTAIQAGFSKGEYIYEGGGVTLKYNEYGNVIKAMATVTISGLGNGINYYKILIE